MNKEINSKISTCEEQITQDTKDPHAILRLGKNATISDIKKAYRKLSLQYHPDKWKDQDRHKELLQKQELDKDEKSELDKLSVEYQVRNLKFEDVQKAYNTLDKDHYGKLRDEFFSATQDIDVEKAKKLLQENVDISTPFFIGDKSITLWHVAVLNAISDPGWERFLKEDILTKLTPTDINSVSDISGNALYIACSRKNIDIAKTLIDHGAKFDGERNNNEIDTVIKLLPYIIDGRKDILDINTRFSDPDNWPEADTVLSYAATNNLRDDKGTLVVQQLFDHYKNEISPDTICSALKATNNNSLDSAKIILQNSHGLQKNHFNEILDTHFNAEQLENYGLILSYINPRHYNDVINKQYFQITQDRDDYQSLGDNQKVEQCKRFLEVIEKHRTISSPKHLKEEGLVADRIKLFENTGKQEKNSGYKDISEIEKGLVAERIEKFSAKDNQKNGQKPNIREQPTGKVKNMIRELEGKNNKESNDQEKSHSGKEEVNESLSHVSVSQLKQKFEER